MFKFITEYTILALENIKHIPVKEEKITRKEALVRVGKYTAFTAAAMMVVLSPVSTSAQKISPPRPRGAQRKRPAS
jgi:hypothetical protein